jgi:hypothetical protein
MERIISDQGDGIVIGPLNSAFRIQVEFRKKLISQLIASGPFH